MKLSGANFPAVESLIRRKRTDVGTHRGETCLASDFFARVVQHTKQCIILCIISVYLMWEGGCQARKSDVETTVNCTVHSYSWRC